MRNNADNVLDNRTGAQVAVLHAQRIDEDLLARQLYCLGRAYNDALIGVEANYSTYPIRELERQRYPRQYVREIADTYTGAIRQAFGFRTDTRTRPIIIAELIQAVRDGIDTINDRVTLEELLTFVRRPETLRPEAEPGAHDDLVMALAIAHHIRPQQRYLAAQAEPEAVRWTEDMWEDYDAAGPQERRRLIEAWGQPHSRR